MEPNNIFNDIKPLTKYTKEQQNSSLEQETPQTYQLKMSDPLLDLSKTKSSYKGIWFFAILALLILAIVLSFFFAKATITLTPKNISLPVDSTVVISKNISELPFETVEVTKTIQVPIANTEQVVIKEKAKGQITIYNTYSSSSQKLIKNTRFQDKSGLIFRIDKEVVVPGYKTIDSKIVPGQISVNILADEIGEKYNLKKENTLTIPGFKGSVQFDKIFAKNESDFSGGGDGTFFKSTTSDDEINKTLKTETQTIIESEIVKKIPEEYILFNNLYTTSTSTIDSLLFKEDKKALDVPVSVEYIIFKKVDIENYIKKVQNIDVNENIVLDPKTLNADIQKIETLPDNQKQYSIYFSGTIKKETVIPVSEILSEIKGQSKSGFLSAIEKFNTTIEKAELSIKPFWVFKIPKDQSKIKIIEK